MNNIKVIGDSGYCPRCDTVWASPGKCKCVKLPKAYSRINKLYKPAELEAAISALNEVIENTKREPKDLIIALHKAGWRLIKVDDK